MVENKRLKNVIFWLISQEIIDTQEDLAEKLGYNPSSLSQIVTGAKPLSEKFINKIVGFCEKINPDYFFNQGSMLRNQPVPYEDIENGTPSIAAAPEAEYGDPKRPKPELDAEYYRKKWESLFENNEKLHNTIHELENEKDRLNNEIKNALNIMADLRQIIYNLEVEKALDAQKRDILVEKAFDVITVLTNTAI
jgi:transcriptional regulator with XRE-family HTH domain